MTPELKRLIAELTTKTDELVKLTQEDPMTYLGKNPVIRKEKIWSESFGVKDYVYTTNG